MLALDVARIEAGLILIEVDFDSVRRALIPEQSYSPFELGILGRFVNFEKHAEFVGRRALEREQERGGPPRRLVGLELEWEPLEELYRAKGLTPAMDTEASRVPVPLYAGRRQIGKATSTTWSPTLKKVVALASVQADHSPLGTDDRGRVDGRGAPRPDTRDGGRAAVLQPEPQDGDRRALISAMKRFDSKALYQALDEKRKSCDLSWPEVATQVGVSVSTLTRTQRGGRMEVDGMLAMVAWLGVPVENFVRDVTS